jgi:hypothetical protein
MQMLRGIDDVWHTMQSCASSLCCIGESGMLLGAQQLPDSGRTAVGLQMMGLLMMNFIL